MVWCGVCVTKSTILAKLVSWISSQKLLYYRWKPLWMLCEVWISSSIGAWNNAIKDAGNHILLEAVDESWTRARVWNYKEGSLNIRTRRMPWLWSNLPSFVEMERWKRTVRAERSDRNSRKPAMVIVRWSVVGTVYNRSHVCSKHLHWGIFL